MPIGSNLDAVETQVRAILEGGGSVLTVDTDRLKPLQGGDDNPVAAQLEATRSIDRYIVELQVVGDNAFTPLRPSNKHLTDIEIVVRVWTLLTHPRRKIAARASRRNRAAETANQIRKALTRPGNMTGVELVGNMLRELGPQPPPTYSRDEKVVEQRLVFNGVLSETVATS